MLLDIDHPSNDLREPQRVMQGVKRVKSAIGVPLLDTD
jgi:hypothetical protein